MFVFLLTSFKISGDDDVFWHLADGRYIIENGTIPTTDVFSFVTFGQKYIPFGWGWDVITFLTYKIGNYEGLTIFRTIISLLLFYIYFRMLRKLNISSTFSIIFLIILLFGIFVNLKPRPHIASLLFLTLLLNQIISFYYLNRTNFKVLYVIPVLFLVWANLHMGMLAGLMLLGLFLISEIINFCFPKTFIKSRKVLSKKELLNIIFIFVVSFSATLINPNTYNSYFSVIHSVVKTEALNTVIEWQPPFDNLFKGSYIANFYKVYLFAGLIILYYAFKRKDILAGLVYVGFALYSLTAIRFTIDYILVVSVFLFISLHFIMINLFSKVRVNSFSSKSIYKIVLTALILFFIFNVLGDKIYSSLNLANKTYGYGIDDKFYPVKLADFIKRNNIIDESSRPFNDYLCGGFLIWNFPGSRNFTDSRIISDEVDKDYGVIYTKATGFEKKLQQYNFDMAIIMEPYMQSLKHDLKNTILGYLNTQNDDWKLVYWDDNSFLFLRNIEKYSEVIKKNEYKYITPYNAFYQTNLIEKGFTEDKETVRNEINRKMSEEPEGVVIKSIVNFYRKELEK